MHVYLDNMNESPPSHTLKLNIHDLRRESMRELIYDQQSAYFTQIKDKIKRVMHEPRKRRLIDLIL